MWCCSISSWLGFNIDLKVNPVLIKQLPATSGENPTKTNERYSYRFQSEWHSRLNLKLALNRPKHIYSTCKTPSLSLWWRYTYLNSSTTLLSLTTKALWNDSIVVAIFLTSLWGRLHRTPKTRKQLRRLQRNSMVTMKCHAFEGSYKMGSVKCLLSTCVLSAFTGNFDIHKNKGTKFKKLKT